MSRLRRQNHCPHSVPVAAEVLEVRSLLSAGAAAVHAAMRHAAIESPAVKLAPTFKGAADALIYLAGGITRAGTGTAFVSGFFQEIGAKVTASFTLSFSGGTPGTIKGKFTGTLADSTVVADGVVYTLNPTGGKLTLTEKVAGKTIKATATVNATPGALLMPGGNIFRSMRVGETFSSTAKGGFAGENISVLFGPAP